jgi:hypothetical protein
VIPGSNPASRSLAEAVQCLEPYAHDARYADLIRRLEAIRPRTKPSNPSQTTTGQRHKR